MIVSGAGYPEFRARTLTSAATEHLRDAVAAMACSGATQQREKEKKYPVASAKSWVSSIYHRVPST